MVSTPRDGDPARGDVGAGRSRGEGRDGDAEGRPRWWSHPPVAVVCFFTLVGVAYAAISYGSEGHSDIAATTEWVTWKAAAAFSVAVAVAAGALGAQVVVRAVGSGAARRPRSVRAERIAAALRPGESNPDGVSARLAWAYTAVAGALVVTVLWFLRGAAKTSAQQWPADLHIVGRLRFVTWAIGLSSLPWLVLVWLLQRYLATRTRPIPLERLRELWDLLNAVVLAFAVFVVLALVPTGALRVAYFAGAKDPSADRNGAEFPATDVLLYGAFFAVLLSVIAVPMVAAYRAAARQRLAEQAPLPEPVTEEAQGQFVRMESALHLDVGLLRSPITALTVFTPLITAALAAYLPGLAG